MQYSWTIIIIITIILKFIWVIGCLNSVTIVAVGIFECELS